MLMLIMTDYNFNKFKCELLFAEQYYTDIYICYYYY